MLRWHGGGCVINEGFEKAARPVVVDDESSYNCIRYPEKGIVLEMTRKREGEGEGERERKDFFK